LYLKGDPYENSDAVFGVKNTLVVSPTSVTDATVEQKYGVEAGCALLEYNFVLVTKDTAMELRYKNASEAMLAQGKKMVFIDGLPVPDVD
jgi:hypothetical protein